MAQSYTFTMLDTTGIQPYIFGSNRMRENVGASALVEQAIRVWPLEVIQNDLHLKSNIQDTSGLDDDLSHKLHIERDELDAEVILRGGGNVMILFANSQHAHRFANAYSRRLLLNAPGLQTAIAHIPVEWDDSEKSLRKAISSVGGTLAEKKANRSHSMPLLGLGVTAICESTGLPATNIDPLLDPLQSKVEHSKQRYRAINASIWAKVEKTHLDLSRDRLKEMIPAFEHDGFQFWYNPELDETSGDDDEGRYLAVVHADGNNMGKRFQQVLDETNANAPTNDRAAIQEMRLLSELVNAAGKDALAIVGGALVKAWFSVEEGGEGTTVPLKRQKKLAGEIELSYWKNGKIVDAEVEDSQPIMPFRPLVYGGDDVTFICDGRLGLSLAVIYLNAFEEATKQKINSDHYRSVREILPEELREFKACAGIATVKLHYPFARAYELAEDLCQNAKDFVKTDLNVTASALDWHIAQSGLSGSINTIREREYSVPAGILTQRPLLLDDKVASAHSKENARWRDWSKFKSVMQEFSDKNGDWFERYNKIVQLREALRQGPAAVESFCTIYKIKDRKLPLLDAGEASLQSTGWSADRRCGYFDAIEALKFFIDLE